MGEYQIMALSCRGEVYLIPAEHLIDTGRQGFLRSKIRICDFSYCIDAWAVFEGHNPEPKGFLF